MNLGSNAPSPLVARWVGIVSAGYWPWRVVSARSSSTDRGCTDCSGTDSYCHSRADTPVIAAPVNTPSIDTATVDGSATAIIRFGFSRNGQNEPDTEDEGCSERERST